MKQKKPKGKDAKKVARFGEREREMSADRVFQGVALGRTPLTRGVAELGSLNPDISRPCVTEGLIWQLYGELQLISCRGLSEICQFCQPLRKRRRPRRLGVTAVQHSLLKLQKFI